MGSHRVWPDCRDSAHERSSCPLLVRVLLRGRESEAVCAVWAQLCPRLFVTLWTAASQTPLPVEFSREEYESGCHSLLQGIFQTPRWNLCLLRLPALAGGFFTTVPPGKPMYA